MNIAFQALVILLLYLPGALFLSAWLGKIARARELAAFASSLTSRAAVSVILALILHAVWVGVGTLAAERMATAWRPDPQLILELLITGGTPAPSPQGDSAHTNEKSDSGNVSNGHQPLQSAQTSGTGISPVTELADSLLPMFVYFASIYIGSWVVGAGLHAIVRKLRLDCKYRWIRFPNRWHYALSGGVALPDVSPEKRIVNMQAVVELEGKVYLYNGLVHDWHFSQLDRQLEWVVLKYAGRSIISDARQTTELNPLPDGLFYLRVSEIKNFILAYGIDQENDRSTYNGKPVGIGDPELSTPAVPSADSTPN